MKSYEKLLFAVLYSFYLEWLMHITAQKKKSFPLRISSVHVTKFLTENFILCVVTITAVLFEMCQKARNSSMTTMGIILKGYVFFKLHIIS